MIQQATEFARQILARLERIIELLERIESRDRERVG